MSSGVISALRQWPDPVALIGPATAGKPTGS